MKTIILGMGNTLLSDDGIGIITKRYLEKRLGNRDNIDFCETSWGGFRIIDLLKGYDYAVIVDSIKTNSKPLGYIHHLQPPDLLPTLRLTSYHDINFITALNLAEELGTKIPSEIDIFAIEIDNNNNISESINPILWRSISSCSYMITEQLESHNIINKSDKLDFSPINSFDKIKELYVEEIGRETTSLKNNINQLEEYQE
jgi:hydrogenase maturation protease